MLAAAPLLSQIAARNLYAHAATAIGCGSGAERLREAWGENGYQLPGNLDIPERSLEFPEVRQAQEEASKYFVNMIELQRGVGGDWQN